MVDEICSFLNYATSDCIISALTEMSHISTIFATINTFDNDTNGLFTSDYKSEKTRRGTLFFIDDFLSFGSAKAVCKALERLVKEGELIE